MGFCRFCGREIPEGGSCSCPDALNELKNTESDISNSSENSGKVNLSKESADTATVSLEKENTAAQAASPISQPQFQPSPSGNTSNNGLTQNNEPDPLKQLVTLIAVALGFILILVFLGSHSGYKNTAKDYFKARYSKHGGKDYYSTILPDDAIDALKDEDEWKEKVEDYNDDVENRMKDWDKKPKFKKISKTKKMKNSELRAAEDYFCGIAELCGADVDDDDIKAKKGYAVTIKYKNTEGDNDKTTIYVVKLKGEGWKVMADLGSGFFDLDF